MPRSVILLSATLLGLISASPALAQSAPSPTNIVRLQVIEPPRTSLSFWQLLRTAASGGKPTSDGRPAPGTKFTVVSSAYAPSPFQTDSTPCITATGDRVREGTVASNFLPLGTILEIEGEKYIVEDRMNKRYNKAIDIFFKSTSEARDFGRKKLEIKILEYGEPGQAIRQPEQSPKELSQEAGAAELPPSFTERFRNNVSAIRLIVNNIIPSQALSREEYLNRHDVDCFNE